MIVCMHSSQARRTRFLSEAVLLLDSLEVCPIVGHGGNKTLNTRRAVVQVVPIRRDPKP